MFVYTILVFKNWCWLILLPHTMPHSHISLHPNTKERERERETGEREREREFQLLLQFIFLTCQNTFSNWILMASGGAGDASPSQKYFSNSLSFLSLPPSFSLSLSLPLFSHYICTHTKQTNSVWPSFTQRLPNVTGLCIRRIVCYRMKDRGERKRKRERKKERECVCVYLNKCDDFTVLILQHPVASMLLIYYSVPKFSNELSISLIFNEQTIF